MFLYNTGTIFILESRESHKNSIGVEQKYSLTPFQRTRKNVLPYSGITKKTLFHIMNSYLVQLIYTVYNCIAFIWILKRNESFYI